MSSPKKRIRNKLISIFANTAASTATRDTKANDLQSKQKTPNWFMSILYGKMKSDIEA